MRPLRIVIASSFAPQPFGHPPGGRWTDVLFRGLVERGHHVSIIAPTRSDAHAEEIRARYPAAHYDLRLHPVPAERPLVLRKLRSAVQPYSYAFGPALRHDLVELGRTRWDILHLEDVWAGWLGLPFERQRTVLNFHSLFRIDDGPMRVVPTRDALVHVLRHRAEARLARAYPTLIGLTGRIQHTLRQLAPRANVEVCPFGFDFSPYEWLPPSPSQPPLVALVGSMHWRPGASAARRLITRIFPRIKQAVPDARCLIVGWQARSALAEHLGAPAVEIVENVADIRPFFARARVLLYAPERATGMKVKVLEAFAFGVPVVTNADGVEGIPAVDNVHAGVCEDDEGMAARTVALLRDPVRRERQRREARALVEMHCAPGPTLDRVEEIYAGMLERAAA